MVLSKLGDAAGYQWKLSLIGYLSRLSLISIVYERCASYQSFLQGTRLRQYKQEKFTGEKCAAC